jgi:NTP pyrophosphatase (non-canonical NTP hydrolase)
VEQELADIQIYLIRLADKLNIDLKRAVDAKIALNERKYPVEKVRGSAKKYTEFDNDC